MKAVGIRALRENPGLLTQCAAQGEFVLLTNRSDPISLAVPFGDDLVKSGAHINVAIRLYEDQVLTLSKAARLARMPVESFMEVLGVMGVVSVDQAADELDNDLEGLSDL